jgi:dienelactone hydrolase
VRGEYLRLAGASAETPAPLLQISPILGGALNDYLLARVIAGWAADAGFSCFFIYQPEEILDAHVDGAGMTRLLRRTTAENLAAIRLLCARPEVDAARIGSFGVSLGAIKNVLLLAAEPRIAGGVLCLPGGDLARILALSRETLVERYFENRSEASGLDRAAIVAELREHLAIEPLAVAPAVGAERVLLFLGSLDDKVPYATGLALYQGLGRPELHVFPVGHYTGMVTAPRAAALGFVWLKERFATLAGEGADP